jgi:iron complex transport system ATP-binding protein
VILVSVLFKTNALSLAFGTKQVLKQLSISIPRDRITAIIGPNGSGKTSLLNCISGINRKYQGDIALNNQSLSAITQQQVARQLGYLHQHMPANLYLTVRQVVELGLTPNMSPWSGLTKVHHDRLNSALEKVDLVSFADRPFDTLSGGEKQRVLIAKVMVQDPDILLLDEPTNHLDIKYQIEAMNLITSLDMSVVCCIHDLNLAARYADYIICLDNGRLAFQGPKNEVLTADNITAVYGVHCQVNKHAIHDTPYVHFDMRANS